MDAPKTLDTTVHYRFQDGRTESFQGKSCYRLSNSWRDAVDKARLACRGRNEGFDRSRIVHATEWSNADIIGQSSD